MLSFTNRLLRDIPLAPFARLRALLDDADSLSVADMPAAAGGMPAAADMPAAAGGGDKKSAPVLLDIGSPQHAPCALALDVLAQAHDYGAYPPIDGIAAFRDASRDWLARRFGLSADFLEALGAPVPLSGTREGLFLAAQGAPEKSGTKGEQGFIAMPNPFYQLYAAAALAAGAQPLYLATHRADNFLPDLTQIPEATLARLRALYLCNPTNPQGTSATRDYLRTAYQLAKTHGFLLLVDECYSDIYDDVPPISMLEIAAEAGDEDAPFLVFHSLSKRSNLAGLRSGFVIGGRSVLAQFLKLRRIAGTQSPRAAQSAAAAAWRDDAHVVENRRLYRAKIDMAETMLKGRFGFYRPAGGFFLWLDVGDGEAVAAHLWHKHGVRVLPGRYLTAEGADSKTCPETTSAAYIRVALVAPLDDTRRALQALLTLETGLDA